MATNSKGTTYTYDFSTDKPTKLGSEAPNQNTEDQTDVAVTELIEQIKEYSAYSPLESAATYVCRKPGSGASFRSCQGTTVVVYVFPVREEKQ